LALGHEAPLLRARGADGSDFAVQYLDIHPEKNLIACAIIYQNGSANLAQMPLNGSRPRNITEGDSLDIAPKWIPGTEKALVYQSAGLGRNASGFVAERSPFRIEKLDFNSEEVVTLVEDPNLDLLGPQMNADGTLYYIKRPYRSLQQQFSVLDIIKQILLIPFRLLYAIFQWLNFFTMYYTGKPLQGAGNPISVDKKQQMKVWGEQIDLEKIANSKNAEDKDAPALVPRSWELVRQGNNSAPEVVAKGVLAFDLRADGSIIYSNGSAVYALHNDGSSQRLAVDKFISQVTILDS